MVKHLKKGCFVITLFIILINSQSTQSPPVFKAELFHWLKDLLAKYIYQTDSEEYIPVLVKWTMILPTMFTDVEFEDNKYETVKFIRMANLHEAEQNVGSRNKQF